MMKLRSIELYLAAADRSQYVMALAKLGLQSLVLVNCGALVAMLTFLGNTQTLARDLDGVGGVWLVRGRARLRPCSDRVRLCWPAAGCNDLFRLFCGR
jgi:hypothetical protein